MHKYLVINAGSSDRVAARQSAIQALSNMGEVANGDERILAIREGRDVSTFELSLKEPPSLASLGGMLDLVRDGVGVDPTLVIILYGGTG